MPGAPAPRRHSADLGEAFGNVSLSWLEWGEPTAPVVFCVHGLTRNAHDFDHLAAALSARGARVIAVDVAGRGRSGWLADPTRYAVPVYAAQLVRLLALLQVPAVDWVGTSMGGLIGMALAAESAVPMRRLILNDVGPFVPKAALAPIGAYLGLDLRFSSLAELEAHLRLIHAPFGPLTDEQWAHLATHSARRTPDGWRLHYDPAIRVPFADAAVADIDLWELWDRIRCPTLVLRGETSGLLTAETAEAMTRRGPHAMLATVPGVGHAPALMADDQIKIVAGWLGL